MEPPSRDMRAFKEAHKLKILHDVADRRSGHLFLKMSRRPGTHRFPRLQNLDNAAKDLARTFVHIFEEWITV